MSQNRTSSDFGGTSRTSGSTGPADTSASSSDRLTTSGANIGSGAGAAAGAATGLAQTAQEYSQKISEAATQAATQAKEYVSDKVSVVGDKIKDLQNADLGEIAENAKEYARQKPGQAILISAAAGLLLGLLIRGRK